MGAAPTAAAAARGPRTALSSLVLTVNDKAVNPEHGARRGEDGKWGLANRQEIDAHCLRSRFQDHNAFNLQLFSASWEVTVVVNNYNFIAKFIMSFCS